jgi:hypothetical protein
MIVYRLTDRIPVKIGEIEFELSPLDYGDRAKILAVKRLSGGNQIEDGYKAAALSVKYGVKNVKGLTYSDGSEMALKFESDGSLADESVSEILQIDGSDKLITIAMNFAANVFKDPSLEGVTVDLKNVTGPKKN